MVELCKKRTAGVEDFEYMIGHTGIKQAEDLRRACKKAFGQEPLTLFELGGVVSANTGPRHHRHCLHRQAALNHPTASTPPGRRTAQSPARAVFSARRFLAQNAGLCYTVLRRVLRATSNPNSVSKSNLGF